MHKLLTLSDAQYEHIVELMRTTRHESFSEFVRYLVLFYEQNQKGKVGRPSNSSKENENDDDNEEKYQYPDYPRTRSAASYNILVDWYATESKSMPPRESLTLHPDWIKMHPA